MLFRSQVLLSLHVLCRNVVVCSSPTKLVTSNPTLSLGSIRFIDADVKDYFAWFREHNGEHWFIVGCFGAGGFPLRFWPEPLRTP